MILIDPTDPQFLDVGKQEDVITLGGSIATSDPAYTDDLEESEELHPWVLLTFIEAPLPDVTPPVVANIVPANGSVNIEKDQPISFTVTDDDSGVSFTTVSVSVRGILAFDGAAASPFFGGWAEASSFGAIPGGFTFNLQPSRADYYRDETIVVRVRAQDQEGNAVDVSFRFSSFKRLRLGFYRFIISSIRNADEEGNN